MDPLSDAHPGLHEAAVPSSDAPRSRSRTKLLAVAFAVLVALASSLALVLSSSSGATTEVRGAKLGLSAGDARDRFAPPGAGSWTSESSPEPVLRWAPSDPGSPVRSATLEFHQGMLVAIRLDVAAGAPEAKGPSLELSRTALIARDKKSDGTTTVTVLSRDCPTHADEAKRLLSGAGR